MINVLVIDDSALIRETLTSILNEDKGINVVKAVPEPYSAVKVLNSENIDVITLDLEMPKMDGLTFLQKLISQRPLPVVICSSIAEQGSENAMKALELGAVEVITKPKLGFKEFFLEEKERIIDAVKSAAHADLSNLKSLINQSEVKPISFYEEMADKVKASSNLLERTTDKIIAIGASTGGTIALRTILSRLPRTCHGIVISQHMPEGFTANFSDSLNNSCKISVKECEVGDHVSMGLAIIARGNTHLTIERPGGYYKTIVKNSERVNRHRPSVDVMFESVAKIAGKNTLGILLTGMGKDGAEGLKKIKEAGGVTVAQDEKSSVVWGMPKAAIDINAANHVLNLDQIVEMIINFK